MTVGHELENITGLKLFHNHLTIDLLSPFFGFGPETWRLSSLFRKEIFESFAESGSTGMIFTYVWALDLEEDWKFVDDICRIFESKGGVVYFVELEAALDERVNRNKTPHRLHHKPTKRNIEMSELELKTTFEKHRLNSHKGEITKDNYLRINNTNLDAKDVAQMVKKAFHL